MKYTFAGLRSVQTVAAMQDASEVRKERKRKLVYIVKQKDLLNSNSRQSFST